MVTTRDLAEGYWARIDDLYDELERHLLECSPYDQPCLEKIAVLRDSHRDLLDLVQDLRS